MHQISAIYESLRFLIIDLQKQLQAITDGIQESDPSFFDKSQERIDYIENAHVNILNRCFSAGRELDASFQPQIQGYEHISYSLKNLSSQLEGLSYGLKKCRSMKLIQKKRVLNALELLNNGLSLIEPAIESEELSLSIDLCKFQSRIEKLCDQQVKRYQERLKTGQNSLALMQSSFIVKDIEAMAEALLKVGEGILSGKLGQFIQIDRYHSLNESLSKIDYDLKDPAITIHSMGETKSGCTISGVTSSSEAQEEILAIFKEGQKDKLLEEKIGIESWHEKFPGIAPEVYSYQKQGDKAALLFEYLTGKTFEKLLLEDRRTLKNGLNCLFETLTDIWKTTEQETRITTSFMSQLQKRLKSVYAVHPEFNLSGKGLRIGSAQQASLETLIKKAAQLEKQLKPAKAVYIHGDFNVDNILYDIEKNDISFIDLHRSEYHDFTQDLSVLIVSFYRLKVYDPKIRKSIQLSMEAIYDFGADYAEQNNDQDYAKRMALGLSRSFISSTRFVLDKKHAKAMLYKGRYLLEQLINLTEKQQKHYQLPKELLSD